jgi:N-carbamoyl-L-amino-acid hydrolase
VPGKVTFTIDMRHPEVAILERTEARLKDIVAERAAPCTASIERVSSVAATIFDPRVIDLVRAKASALGLPNMDMPSGAGHDAMHIADLCPAGMIFVPCEKGISHNVVENAAPADLAAGARVLVETLVALANR